MQKLSDRKVEAHLGDVCGEPLPPPRVSPYRHRLRIDRPRLVETVVAWLAFIILLALLVAFLVMLPLYVSRAIAQDIPQIRNQIRRDCRVDALHYCTKDALRCLKREDQECRAAVIACMSANKPKLRAACARHIW